MGDKPFLTRIAPFALPVLTALLAIVLFLAMFPLPLPVGIAVLVFSASVWDVALVVGRRRRDDARSRDFSDVLTKLVKQLGHGLSAFASGDLRFRLRKPDITARDPEASALEKRLIACVDDFNSITTVPLKRVCFVGANSYQEGKVAGERIGALLGGKGKVAYFIPDHTQVSHVLRMKGCHDYLSEHFHSIENLPYVETTGDPERPIQKARELVALHPDLSLIYASDGYSPGVVAEGLAKDGVTRVKIVGFDASRENVALLKRGLISGLVE